MTRVRPFLRPRPAAAVLDGYLAAAPLAHALFRAAEAHHLGRLALPRPVLDLGCGAGEFAALALDSGVDIGLDLSARQLAGARATGCYGQLCRGDARRLPFADGRFATVLAVSVLEHIPRPAAVLAEACRVLQPGGCLVATVVLADLHRYLFYPRLCRRLRLAGLGRLYVRWQDRLLRHRTLLTRETWEALLVGAGFRVAVSRKIVSPALTAWWDALLPAAWPFRLGLAAGWRPR